MKRLAIVLSIASFASTTHLFAKNPPKTTGPTPVWDRSGKEESDHNPGVYDGPALPVPPSLYPFLSGALLPQSIVKNHTFSNSSSSFVESIDQPTLRRGRAASSRVATPLSFLPHLLNVPSFISPWYDTDASNGAGTEDESALVALTNASGTFVAEAYQEGTGGNPPTAYTIHVATANDPSIPGNFTSSTPYAPPGYTHWVDPTLATNPYTDGIRPGALYLTSLGANLPSGQPANPNTVRIWGSDDGGRTWTTSGQTVAFTTSTDTSILDKPVSDVSWFPGSRGHLYVAWVKEAISGPTNFSILLRRNRNGLWERCRPAGGGCDTAWDAPVTINDGRFFDLASDPQVVVNPDNGNVYVFWYSSNNSEIRMVRSTDQGATFQPDVTLPPITVIKGVYSVASSNAGYLQNGLRAQVVPMIRYNSAAHVMMAAWHARTQPDLGNGNETALYFATFNPDTITTATALGPLQPVNDAAGTQIQPAIDNDDNGNVLMTYYTTENHITDNRYQIYGMALSSSGQVLPGCGPTALDGVSSYANAFEGDYHDNYYFTFPSALGSLWNISWARNTGSTQNPAFDVWSLGVK